MRTVPVTGPGTQRLGVESINIVQFLVVSTVYLVIVAAVFVGFTVYAAGRVLRDLYLKLRLFD